MSDFRDDIIRASEISQYVYCNRAWWLKRVHGVQPGNTREMAAGTAHHQAHSRWLSVSRLVRRLAYALLLAAIILIVLQLIWG